MFVTGFTARLRRRRPHRSPSTTCTHCKKCSNEGCATGSAMRWPASGGRSSHRRMSGGSVIPPRSRSQSRSMCRQCSTPSLTKQWPEYGSRSLSRTRGSRKACWNMLNELYTLDRSLNRFRVSVQESHPWFKRLGRSPLLIAGVDASGAVAGIGQMDTQDAVSLFKIQPSNQANFPQVTWNGPIWNLDRKSGAVQEWLTCPAKEIRRRAELLRQACA